MPRHYRTCLLLLAAVVMAVLGTTRPAAADAVNVRGWSHDTFGRIVFDWHREVGYTAGVDGNVLTIAFDRPIEARFEPALRHLGDYVVSAEVAPDGQTVRMALTRPFALSTFRNDGSVVVDLKPSGPLASGPPASGPAASGRAASGRAAQRAEAPMLPVRFDGHDSYSRVTFEWMRPVHYSVDRKGEQLRIRFNRVARVDADALRAADVPGFAEAQAAADDGGLLFSARVPGDARLRHFRNGTQVVVDVLLAEAPAPAASEPAPQATAPVPPAAPPSGEGGTVSAARAVQTDAPAPPTYPRDAPKSLLPTTADAASQPPGPTGAPAAAQQQAQADRQVEVDRHAEAERQVAVQPQVGAGNGPGERPADAAAAVPAGGTAVVLFFEWPEPVGAAVFERAGYVWVVFDRRSPIDLAPLRSAGAGILSRIEQLPAGDASVLRILPVRGLSPRAYRQGSDWAVAFEATPGQPDRPLAVAADADAADGGLVAFPAVDSGRILRLPDPEVGDVIHVATIAEPGRGVAGSRRFPEFTVLASAQGIAIVPLSEEIALSESENGVVVSAPGGLHLSGVRADAGATGAAGQGLGRRVFDLTGWQRRAGGDYYTVRQELQLAAATAGELQRDAARLDLARFQFAHGRGPETLAVLRTMQLADPTLANQADFKALRGAAALLRGDLEDAAGDLADPRLDRLEEVHLWRGWLAAETGDWREAERIFALTEDLRATYPDPVGARLALARADTALHSRDPATAARVLSELDERRGRLSRGQVARLDYLTGRVAFLRRNLDQAEDLWKRLFVGTDAKYAAHADLSLINLGLLQDTLSEDEAIARLERLRFRWRGDDLEFQVLRRLGDLYFGRDDYRNGLSVFRVAATYFPAHPEVAQVADKMSAIFRDLYLDGKADMLPPLTALALYDEFRELTPPGADGNRMIEILAQRLVDVDLLNRAAELLQHQVQFRLQGPVRASVGARLALIHLLDRNAEAALAALDGTEFPQIDRPVEDDRRRIRARVLFELGRRDEAVELLAGDVSRSADQLLAEIHWKTGDWPAAARVYQRLAGPPPEETAGYGQADAQTILDWAVALRLAEDESGLALLRSLYGPAMARSPIANAFSFIASPSPADGPLDLATITRRIADVDRFEAFLQDYRRRLLTTPAPPAGGETAEAAASG